MDICLLVIGIDPEDLAALDPEGDVAGKEQGFFHLNGDDILSCHPETFMLSSSGMDRGFVSTVVPKSSSMMNSPNCIFLVCIASRSGLWMTNIRWSVA